MKDSQCNHESPGPPGKHFPPMPHGDKPEQANAAYEVDHFVAIYTC